MPQLVLDAQPLGNRAVQVGAAQPQFVGQRFCLRVQIGEMVAPAFDFGARGGDGIGLLRGAGARQPVIGAGKGFGGIGGGGNPVFELQPVEIEIGKQRVGQPALDRLHPAARCRTGQRARVEIKTFGEPQQDRGGQRPLVALDQVEVAGRNRERLRHRGLRQAIGAADAADGGPGEKFLLCHEERFVTIIT